MQRVAEYWLPWSECTRSSTGACFRARPAGAVALAVPRKRLAHGHFSGWLRGRLALLSVLGIASDGRHVQGVAGLAHGHLRLALGEVLIGAHRVGWPKMTKAFLTYRALTRPG